VVSRLRVPLALLGVFGLACVAAIHLVTQPNDVAGSDVEAAAGSETSLPPPPPAVARERDGERRAEVSTSAVLPAAPDVDVLPLFDTTTRFHPGESIKLKFRIRDRRSGSPASKAEVSVSLFHGRDPEVRLAANEVEDGVYEFAFTPEGPGQYRLVVSSGGVRMGSLAPVKLGVVGTVGATDGELDASDLLDVDPRRSRSKGLARRMRR
jgi:hypothetical protein